MQLGESFIECPPAWCNFVTKTVVRIYGPGYEHGLSTEQIQKELDQFNAVFIDHGADVDGVVDFPSERHYSLFVLKYGEEHVERG
jgi:hypothetical protein